VTVFSLTVMVKARVRVRFGLCSSR